MMPPRINLPSADAVLARHLSGRQLRTEALADDLLLLLQRPRTPPLRPRGSRAFGTRLAGNLIAAARVRRALGEADASKRALPLTGRPFGMG